MLQLRVPERGCMPIRWAVVIALSMALLGAGSAFVLQVRTCFSHFTQDPRHTTAPHRTWLALHVVIDWLFMLEAYVNLHMVHPAVSVLTRRSTRTPCRCGWPSTNTTETLKTNASSVGLCGRRSDRRSPDSRREWNQLHRLGALPRSAICRVDNGRQASIKPI